MIKKVYWVDLPNPKATGDDDSWINVETFFTRREAKQFLLDRYGIKEFYSGCFITAGEDYHD